MSKKKRGRPKQYDNLDASLRLNYPKEMKNEVIKIASKSGISRSKFIREAIDFYVKNYDKIQESKESGERPQLTDNDISSLLTIIHHCHELGLIPYYDWDGLRKYIDTYRIADSKDTKKLALGEICRIVRTNKHVLDKHKDLMKIFEKIVDFLEEKQP